MVHTMGHTPTKNLKVLAENQFLRNSQTDSKKTSSPLQKTLGARDHVWTLLYFSLPDDAPLTAAWFFTW